MRELPTIQTFRLLMYGLAGICFFVGILVGVLLCATVYG